MHEIGGKTDYHHKVNVVWHMQHVWHGDMYVATPTKQLMEMSSQELDELHKSLHEEGGEHNKDGRSNLSGLQPNVSKT